MVPTPKPSRLLRNTLLPTRKLIHSRLPVLATLPGPTPIPIPLHSLPLKARPSSNLNIATSPHITVRLVGVRVGIQRHGFGQIPVAELGDGADDVDAFAPGGADLDGEGEGDGAGVRASWGCRRDGDGEGGVEVAVSGGVDVPVVLEGVDGAVCEGQGGCGGVGDLVGFGEGDYLGGGVVAEEKMLEGVRSS